MTKQTNLQSKFPLELQEGAAERIVIDKESFVTEKEMYYVEKNLLKK